MPTKGYAATNAKSGLAPFSFERREPLATDVTIEILYCGVCHSDLHQVRDEWSGSIYPIVPGHEIVGRVTRVGANVQRFKVGDLAAVGCMVGSCGSCENCKLGQEQYCTKGNIQTYNSPDPHGGHTFGGYSESIVVDESFTLRVPSSIDPAAAAPLLCAGITTYSPLRHWKAGPGKKVGVVGLGGLGHMGLKFARAFGAHVVAFTSSAKKIEDAKRLGAHEVVVSTKPEEMKKHLASFDFILNTVAADHDINAYLELLKLDATLTMVGAPEKPLPVGVFNLLIRRTSFAGSAIGGIAETQEMLDFCAKNAIASDVEIIPIQKINEAYERMLRGDVRYRFVIDMASLKA